jgi:PKD repeat protein
VDFVDLSIDAPSDVILIWDWDFGDGQNSTDENPSYNYAVPDTFSVELYVETTGGCGAYHTEQVIVHALPVASFTYAGHCSIDAIQFTDQSTLGSAIITSWLWNFGQPSSGLENVSNIINPTKIYNESGTFDVILEVTDANNCVDDTTITIAIDPSPTAGFLANDGCENEGIIFLNSSFATPPSSIWSYLWDFGDATFSIMTNPVKSFPDFGLQTIELEVTANNGCKDIEQQTLYINPNPIPEMQIGPMCMGTYTSLSNSSTIAEGSIASTLWIINSADSLTELNAEYVFDIFGQQEIVLQTTSLAGCTSEISDFVDVVLELDAAFNAGSGIAAAGEPFQFTNQSIGVDNSFWTFGDGFNSTDFSPLHMYNVSVTGALLDVQLIVFNNEGCSDTTVQQILIESRELDLALTNLFLEEDNGFYIIGVQLKNVGSVTIYEADLSVFLPIGLIASETWTGTLLPNTSEIYIFNSHPNAFVSTQDETDDFICVEGIGYDNSSGTEQDLSNNKVCRDTEGEAVVLLPLYPNPANDEITLGVLVTVDSEISLEIVDSRGRLVKTVIQTQTLEKGLYNYLVNTSQLESGTYFVVLKSDEQVVYKMEIVH